MSPLGPPGQGAAIEFGRSPPSWPPASGRSNQELQEAISYELMAELDDAATEVLRALRDEHQLPVDGRVTKAHDQDVDDWISMVEKLLAAGQALAPPGEAWISGALPVAVANWPEGSAVKVAGQRFLRAYQGAEEAWREKAAAEHRRTYGNFRGHYINENRAGVTATHEAVWGLVSFFESSANAQRALTEGAKWSEWAKDDHAYWASSLAHMPGARQPIDLHDTAAAARAADRVSASIRHAHAYFDAALRSPNTVRPNLLYYGSLALTKALIWASFEDAPPFHGLSAGSTLQRTVWIRADGEFAAFHDCICTIPTIYAGRGKNGREIEFDALLANVRPLRAAIERTFGPTWKYVGQIRMVPESFDRRLTDVNGNQVLTHALAIDIAALFLLSNWARYHPVEWEEVLRGEKSGEAHVYLSFLDHIALNFPLQTANFLMGVRNVFTPAMTDREFKDKVNEVLADGLRF